MMHGDSRVMVVVCLVTAKFTSTRLSTSAIPQDPRRTIFCFVILK